MYIMQEYYHPRITLSLITVTCVTTGIQVHARNSRIFFSFSFYLHVSGCQKTTPKIQIVHDSYAIIQPTPVCFRNMQNKENCVDDMILEWSETLEAIFNGLGCFLPSVSFLAKHFVHNLIKYGIARNVSDNTRDNKYSWKKLTSWICFSQHDFRRYGRSSSITFGFSII